MNNFLNFDENHFNKLVFDFNEINNECEDKLIFHVGTGAGFYSEVGAMMECIMYCLSRKVKFILYSDDANFSNGLGWEEFFRPFCEINKDPLNIKANYRYKNHYRSGKYVFPNYGLRRWFYPNLLRKKYACKYLTQDVFSEFTGKKFKIEKIDFKNLGVCGTVGEEYAKLKNFCLAYNEKTLNEINGLIKSIKLPKDYISIHIRGGDKIDEFDELVDVDYALGELDRVKLNVNNVFLFTDDYRNYEILRLKRPEWNIYTLTNPEERGYFNADFYQTEWTYRRKNLIKLFSIVEICIKSHFHFGFENACVNEFIKSARSGVNYHGMIRGKFVKKTLSGRIYSYLKSLAR